LILVNQIIKYIIVLQNFKLWKLRKYNLMTWNFNSPFNDMKSRDNEKIKKTQPSLKKN